MARLLPRVLLQLDVVYDKYLNTRRRLVTGGRNGGYGHKRLTASFVNVWLIVMFMQSSSPFCAKAPVYQTQASDDGARQ